MKKAAIIIFLGVLASSNTCLATPNKSDSNKKQESSKSEPDKNPQLFQNTDDPAKQQILLLQEQNKLIRGYQTDLLSTVYWCLSAVLAMAAILIGYNWYRSIRVYERDKRALREQILTKQQGIHNEFSQEILKQIANEFKDIRTSTEKNLTEKIRELSQKLNETIDTKSSSIDNKFSALLSGVDRRILTLEFLHYDESGRIRMVDKSYSLAFTSYLRALSCAAELKSNTFIDFALDGILASLKNNAVVFKKEKETFGILIDKIDKSLEGKISEISPLIAKAREDF